MYNGELDLPSGLWPIILLNISVKLPSIPAFFEILLLTFTPGILNILYLYPTLIKKYFFNIKYFN